jgi:metal transporter CNNM
MQPQWMRVTRILAPMMYAVASVPLSYAAPLLQAQHGGGEADPKSPDDPGLWLYLGTAVGLVLLGGIFAGLTIA